VDRRYEFLTRQHITKYHPATIRAVLQPSRREVTNIVIQSTTAVMLFNICLRLSSYTAAVRIVFVIMIALSACSSFTPRCQQTQLTMLHTQPTSSILPRPVYLFRELISDDEEDLRADIAVIREQVGLEAFLRVDDRLCVIK
jgi:hypothetical protein